MKRRTLRRIRRLILGSLISAASMGVPLGAAERPSSESDSVAVGPVADAPEIGGSVPADPGAAARPPAERQLSRTSPRFHRSMEAFVSPTFESWPPIGELGSSLRDLVGCWVAAHRETLTGQFAVQPPTPLDVSERIEGREPEPERLAASAASDSARPDPQPLGSRPRAAAYGSAGEEYRPYDIADCDRHGNPYDPAWDCRETADHCRVATPTPQRRRIGGSPMIVTVDVPEPPAEDLASAPSANGCPFETFWDKSPCRPPRDGLASRPVASRPSDPQPAESQPRESRPGESRQPASGPSLIVNLSEVPAVLEDDWCHPDGWALASSDLERAVDPTFASEATESDVIAGKLPPVPLWWMPRFDRPQCVWPRDLRVGWSPLEATGDFAVAPPAGPEPATSEIAVDGPPCEPSAAELRDGDDEWRRAVSIARRWREPVRRWQAKLEGTDLKGFLGRFGQGWFARNRSAETPLDEPASVTPGPDPITPGPDPAAVARQVIPTTAGQRLLDRAEAIEAAEPVQAAEPVEVAEIAEAIDQLRRWWADARPFAEPWVRLATQRSASDSALR